MIQVKQHPKDLEQGVPTNEQIAGKLDEVSRLLEFQGANHFRIRAYAKAAETLRWLNVSVGRIAETEGVAGLVKLPSIGKSLAHAIEHFVIHRRYPLLERLQGDEEAEHLFATVADIGPTLAHRIHEQLDIDTLPELLAAANDGRLAQVSGMGSKRLRAVKETLSSRLHVVTTPDLSPSPVGREQNSPALEPQQIPAISVEEILSIDAQYRRLAQQNKLPLIAPKRFNPTATRWLPVLHTQRDSRQYTALYSNTARAHDFGATHDWVVIFRDDDFDHGHWTVITAKYGNLVGQRIVRGREQECRDYYHNKLESRSQS